MEEKAGIPLVCEAVTFAASLLASLAKSSHLPERDRLACADVRARLERAERVLYGHPEPAD